MRAATFPDPAVGFASGEVAVFRWQSEASELSPCEAEVGDVDPGLRVPFGISCVGRWKLGSQPIVFLATERCTTTLQPEVEGREGDYVSLMDIQKFCFDFRNTVSTTLPSKTTMCHRTLACELRGLPTQATQQVDGWWLTSRPTLQLLCS